MWQTFDADSGLRWFLSSSVVFFSFVSLRFEHIYFCRVYICKPQKWNLCTDCFSCTGFGWVRFDSLLVYLNFCWSYVIVTVCFVKYSMWRIREVENVCSIWNREMWRNQMERIFEVPVLDGTGHAKCRLVISKTKPKWNDVDYNLCVG